MKRSLHFLFPIYVGLVTILAASNQSLSPPRFIGGSLPFFQDAHAHEFGVVPVNVSVNADGTVVPRLESTEHRQIAGPVARAVADWRVAATPGTQFVTTVRFLEMNDRLCSFDVNEVAVIRAPSSIEVYGRPRSACTPAPRPTTPFTRSELRGRTLDDAGEPLAGAEVSVVRPGGLFRLIRSDRSGFFLMSGLPEGSYRVEVSLVGYAGEQFELLISRTAGSEDIECRLPRDESQDPPKAVVTAAQIPTYPADALADGLSGQVTLRLSMNRNRVVDVDASGAVRSLLEAAKKNVMTWRFEEVTAPVVIVNYKFQALARDCGADPQPVTRMEFPHLVEMRARSGEPCAGSIEGSGQLPANRGQDSQRSHSETWAFTTHLRSQFSLFDLWSIRVPKDRFRSADIR